MTDPEHTGHPADNDLVAYLDGRLPRDACADLERRIASDPVLQRRLFLLARGNRPFREAFEPLLEQAPRDRLETMLAGLAPAQAAVPMRARRLPPRAAVSSLAAALALFLAGMGIDRMLPVWRPAGPELPSSERQADEDDWRQAVAEYLTLYSPETLAAIPDDAGMRERELAAVGSKMRLGLSPQQVSVPGLAFKRAQLFEYDGKPLGQIAYLDPDSGPVALCIYPSADANSARQVERRLGFNVVFWSRNGHGFMLIGRAPAARLQTIADGLSDRIAG